MSDMDALTAADIEAEAARLRAQIESTLAQIEIERARQRELHATLQFNIDSANRLADATRTLSADVSRHETDGWAYRSAGNGFQRSAHGFAQRVGELFPIQESC